MAQGDAFKIGVHVPLANSKFEYVDQYLTFKNTEATPGSQVIDTATPAGAVQDPRASPYVLAVGNSVVLGPSTHADNPGAVETVTITAIDATSFTAVTVYKYMLTDKITVRTIPVGWTGEATQVSGKKFEVVDNKMLGVSGNLDTGKAVKISRDALTELSPSNCNWLAKADPDTVYGSVEICTLRPNTEVDASKAAMLIDLSAISSATTYKLRLYFTAGLSGTLAIYRIKQAAVPTQETWNSYKTGSAWDAAGCSTSDTDYYADAVYSGSITAGWNELTLDATLMNEIVGGAPTKPNYGLIISHTNATGPGFYWNSVDYAPTLKIYGSDTTHAFFRTTNIGTVLNSNGNHRLAAFVKNTGTYGQCALRLNERNAANADLSTHTSPLTAACADFTEFTATLSPDATTSKVILSCMILSATAAATTFTVGNIILTHAKGTDDTAAGVYTFDDIPIKGSLDYGYYSGRRKISLANNTNAFSDASGGRVRWWISCAFTYVPQGLYDNLLTLLGQLQGRAQLALFTGITDLPPVIVGELTISALRKASSNLDTRVFNINFEGC